MRNVDFRPLYRSTIGFDRLFSMLDQLATADTSGQAYPPYNIERTGDNAYRITIAVAGFTDADLTIEARENTLLVKGDKKPAAEEAAANIVYRGIASRAFERRFQLADHVEVKAASLEHGLLHIDLVRDIPEEKRSRKIPIGSGLPQIANTVTVN